MPLIRAPLGFHVTHFIRDECSRLSERYSTLVLQVLRSCSRNKIGLSHNTNNKTLLERTPCNVTPPPLRLWHIRSSIQQLRLLSIKSLASSLVLVINIVTPMSVSLFFDLYQILVTYPSGRSLVFGGKLRRKTTRQDHFPESPHVVKTRARLEAKTRSRKTVGVERSLPFIFAFGSLSSVVPSTISLVSTSGLLCHFSKLFF